MAGQGIDRREVLRAMALAAGASGFPGFQRWVFAHDHSGAAPGPARGSGAAYQPQFFTPAEYRTIERLAELILPTDDTPGAREAGASEFIDFMAAADSKIQFKLRYGLAWLDAHALARMGAVFRELAPAQQTAILERLAYSNLWQPGEEEGRSFFRLVREYVIMGFYTSRVGLEVLGYPGLQLYSESPECRHPEHRNLFAPK